IPGCVLSDPHVLAIRPSYSWPWIEVATSKGDRACRQAVRDRRIGGNSRPPGSDIGPIQLFQLRARVDAEFTSGGRHFWFPPFSWGSHNDRRFGYLQHWPRPSEALNSSSLAGCCLWCTAAPKRFDDLARVVNASTSRPGFMCFLAVC